MASYPGAIPTFTTKLNNVDNILAGHVNDPQDEIIAIASALGTNPNVSPAPTAGYVSGAATWNNVADRLENIEAGIGGDSHNQYVKVTGGSTIAPATTGTVGLTVAAIPGQTASLMEWKDSSGTVKTSINNAGVLVVDGVVVPTSSDIEELKAVSWLGIGLF